MLRRAKGIRSKTVIERTGKDTGRRDDSRIRRGRKCLEMLRLEAFSAQQSEPSFVAVGPQYVTAA